MTAPPHCIVPEGTADKTAAKRDWDFFCYALKEDLWSSDSGTEYLMKVCPAFFERNPSFKTLVASTAKKIAPCWAEDPDTLYIAFSVPKSVAGRLNLNSIKDLEDTIRAHEAGVQRAEDNAKKTGWVKPERSHVRYTMHIKDAFGTQTIP